MGHTSVHSTSKRRRINPDRKPGPKPQVVIRQGYVVSRDTDLHRLQRFREIPPEGWCKRYWWDYELPEFEDETGGRVTKYCADHMETIQTVNHALGIALADESRLYCKGAKEENNTDQQLDTHVRISGCIPPQHQILRDTIQYRPRFCTFPQLITLKNSENSTSIPYTFPLCGSTVSKEYPTQGESAEVTAADIVPSWERHRLLDVVLFDEFQSQQRLREAAHPHVSSSVSFTD